MESPAKLRTDGSAAVERRSSRLWTLAFLGLVGWQAWTTLMLFGADHPWRQLTDEQPIVSGRHALHLYHGYLGSQSLLERGSVCCYDPAFQAGYPKTPVFDSGSRPAELFLALVGGEYRPSAYKIGVAVCCLAVPFLLFTAAWGTGFGRGACLLATALGQLVWWGAPCRQLLEAGDLDLLLCGLVSLTQVGLLVRFHRRPGLGCWLGLIAGCSAGWYTHPLLFALLFPLLLVYYLSVGARHYLPWHLALLATVAGGIAVNHFWLLDWFAYWWIRSPLQLQSALLPHRTFHTLWAAPLWGEAPDRLLALLTVASAAAGIAVLNETNQRPAARLLGLGAGCFLGLALAGIAWEPLGRLGTSRFLVLALWFSSLPAAYALTTGFSLLGRLLGGAWRSASLAGALAGLGIALCAETLIALGQRCAGPVPLRIGLATEDDALIAALCNNTSTEARVLWEERSGDDSGWTALLPLLTGRSFLGGLDPDVQIEHSHASLLDEKLAGRPLSTYSDADLDEFFTKYNVGWVVCRTAPTAARLRQYAGAQQVVETDSGVLLALKLRSYALKGQAQLTGADCQHIALADLVPEDGTVVLSLHFLAGLRVSPSRVAIEPEYDPLDPIPFIRLRVPGPVARLTITWRDR